ncbi:hypothetical protein BDW02DRAFT_589979 [Decorospora gaudefroyi]|uniref:Alkaline phytoceramidase n=1 Tax=Decorospora gaudefroyi TaxID=184978 RepID=A0A6A5KDD7_9PLEO|nr:hypothetical protein BDW02DRAFT_589979 [Decorospora gaudefroyi]
MGHHNRHHAGGRYALSGVWGPPDSTANFCEEDYAVTRYIAEFVNALTNLAYVYFALRSMYRHNAMSISLLLLGTSSFLFHATLRQTLQFADELSMLGLAWTLLQAIMTVRAPSRQARYINTSLAIAFPTFSTFYVWTGKIIYHVSAFGAIIVLIVGRAHYLFHWVEPAFPRAQRARWRYRGRNALVMLLGGYLLWYVDLEYCAEMRRVREGVGVPWAWLLGLHGWWHVLTAVSASWFMDIVRELGDEVGGEKMG